MVMARTDRAYRKMMCRKTMLCAEKDYRDILLRDCQEQARKKTDAYRTQLMGAVYRASRLDSGGGGRQDRVRQPHGAIRCRHGICS